MPSSVGISVPSPNHLRLIWPGREVRLDQVGGPPATLTGGGWCPATVSCAGPQVGFAHSALRQCSRSPATAQSAVILGDPYLASCTLNRRASSASSGSRSRACGPWRPALPLVEPGLGHPQRLAGPPRAGSAPHLPGNPDRSSCLSLPSPFSFKAMSPRYEGKPRVPAARCLLGVRCRSWMLRGTGTRLERFGLALAWWWRCSPRWRACG